MFSLSTFTNLIKTIKRACHKAYVADGRSTRDSSEQAHPTTTDSSQDDVFARLTETTSANAIRMPTTTRASQIPAAAPSPSMSEMVLPGVVNPEEANIGADISGPAVATAYPDDVELLATYNPSLEGYTPRTGYEGAKFIGSDPLFDNVI